MIFSRTIFFPALFVFVQASPSLVAKDGHGRDHVNARTIYQFQGHTRAENIAVRKNGNLLITLSDRPELYEVDPFNPSSPKLIHHFAGYSGLAGITETTPDVFLVNAGNITFGPIRPVPKSFSVWKLDLSCADGATVSKVTDMPEASYLNGLTTLDSRAGVVLTGDCTSGRVFRLDTNTGNYTVALDNALLQPPPNATLPIGINGIRMFRDHLYFTNTFKGIYARVPVDLVTGEAKGPYEVLGTNVTADDLAVKAGVGYLAGSIGNVIIKIKTGKESEVIAGNLNSTEVAGATAVAFGRTKKDKEVLYVVTSGTEVSPVNGTFVEPGKVVALDI
ncbi:uncharacterized protein ColSpa_11620 [Colletotrichum spaethianum]|uniref:Quino amine dehydrogenase beta chain protein n=1 Tax=Colletotrichum spaethianum TaxID=700344 RepID=A0AA37PFU5_9PEZI|nr:uncharacterized protein ColSpa_11620 [Colletotrichum spaethianum]GKT51439.1 hypothetical protein ColSpa_11620 [Colletotrichum spaethianum]